jgi:hypothetical protein
VLVSYSWIDPVAMEEERAEERAEEARQRAEEARQRLEATNRMVDNVAAAVGRAYEAAVRETVGSCIICSHRYGL